MVALLAVRRDLVDGTRQNWLPRQRSLGDEKTSFRPFINNHSSTIHAIWVNIGQVDFEFKGMIKSLKVLEVRNTSIISPGGLTRK